MGRTGVGVVGGHTSRSHRDGHHDTSQVPGRLAGAVRDVLECLRSVFALEALPLNVLAFLVGRATVLQAVTPFGTALFAATLALNPRRCLGVALAAAAGMLSTGSVVGCLEFTGAAAGLALLMAVFDRQGRSSRPLTLAALTFTVTLVAGCVAAFLGDATPYRFLMAFFAALLGFVLTLVYLTALPPLASARAPVALGAEQVVAGAITAATALAGLSGLGYAGLRASGVLGGLLVVTAGAAGGAGIGAAVGTASGVILALCSAGGLSGLALLAVGGLLTGVFRDYGKAGAAAGYFFGVLLLSPLIEEALHLRGVILEAGTAAGLFLILPTHLVHDLRATLGGTVGKGGRAGGPGTPENDYLGRRLIDFSQVFGQLAATLRELSATSTAASPPSKNPDPSTLASLAEAACRVCESCRLFRTCWKGDRERTRGAMQGLLEITAQRGQLEARDVPTHLRRRCVHLGELVTTMNFLQEIAALNQHWRKKLRETRGVVCRQLDGLSGVLRALGEGLREEVAGSAGLADEVFSRLERAGFPALSVVAGQIPDGKPEFEVTAEVCDTGEACREVAAPAVSAAAGETLVVSDVRCGLVRGEPECSFRLAVPRRLEFKLGVAQARKAPGGISGDSYLIEELPGNRLCAVLSDGTGAGPQAAAESQATVRMLEELFRLGFDTDMTVRTVNSLLLLKSVNERFATLDLLTVDLHDGQGRFIKVGATPSYLRRGGEVTVIHSASLPLGVLPEVSTDGHRQTFQPGDLVVLATDGLLAASDHLGPAPSESWVVELLREVGNAGPQEVADALVEAAVSFSRRRLTAAAGGGTAYARGGGLRDDITVLVLRFSSREGA